MKNNLLSVLVTRSQTILEDTSFEITIPDDPSLHLTTPGDMNNEETTHDETSTNSDCSTSILFSYVPDKTPISDDTTPQRSCPKKQHSVATEVIRQMCCKEGELVDTNFWSKNFKGITLGPNNKSCFQ